MTNVRKIHVDWYGQHPPRFNGGPQLAYQGDHLSNMVVFDHAPELPNYYLLVEMKTDEAGPVVTLPEILLEGAYWVIPNYYTQICQKITYQVCCKTESGDFEHHSAKFEGTILPVIKHNGEPIDQSPMFDPYIDILDKRVDELIVAAGDIQIDSELKSDSTNPVQNKVVKAAVDAVNGRLQRQQGIIAEAFSAQSTYNVGDSVIYEAGLYTFKANKTAGSWDATKVDGPFKVTEQISNLKEEFNEISDERSITDLFTEIAYISNNNKITYWHSGAWGVVYFACEPNTKYKITKTQGNKYLCGWINEEPAINVAVNNYTDFVGATSAEYTTGDAAKYVLVQVTNNSNDLDTIVASMSVSYISGAKDNVVRDAVSTLSETTAEIIQDVERNTEAIDAAIESHNYTEYSTIDIVPAFTDGYCNQATGNTSPLYGDVWHYTQMITVQSGDVIKAVPLSDFRKIAAFNDGVIVPSAGKDGSSETAYTVPNGVNGLRITILKNRNTTGFTIYRQENNKSYIVKQNKLGYMATKGNLSDGESLILPVTNAKNHIVFTFSANVTTFGSIEIGKGTAKIVIDNTNIEVYSQGNLINTYPHGLTFGNRIQIIIEKETGKMFSLARIVGDGVTYSITNNATFYTDEGAPFVTSDGSALTDCVFSFTSRHINKPIWLFGDSYFSYSWDDPHAWTWYLIQDGFIDSCLLNGYAGEASEAAYTCLVNMLNITVPRIVVWCLGMNNPDNINTWVGAVNPSWKQVYDKVVDLSKKYGFELVLYTTPTTPTMDNSYKNAIIRDSVNTYRYVDADKAVRIDDEGHWVGYGTENPALATDNVHPTSLGALIIYHQFLADLPELTTK